MDTFRLRALMSLMWAVLFVWPHLAVAEGPKSESRRDPSDAAHVAEVLQLDDVRIQRLDLMKVGDGRFSTTVKVDGTTWTLELHKHSIRSTDFRALVQVDESSKLVPIEGKIPVKTYRGMVVEKPGVKVRARITDAGLEAIIYTADGEVHGIQPLAKLGLHGEVDAHAVYRDSDWNGRDVGCGTGPGH